MAEWEWGGLWRRHPERDPLYPRSAVRCPPNRCPRFGDTPGAALGCPSCSGGLPRMALVAPQQCLSFGGCLWDGFGVPHPRDYPRVALRHPLQQCLCFGVSPLGWLWGPLALEVLSRMVLGSSCIEGSTMEWVWGCPPSCACALGGSHHYGFGILWHWRLSRGGLEMSPSSASILRICPRTLLAVPSASLCFGGSLRSAVMSPLIWGHPLGWL